MLKEKDNFLIEDNKIVYNGQVYLCCWIDSPYDEPSGEHYLVATTSLLDELFDSDCNPKCREAALLDEHVFYYVDDSNFTVNENELLGIVKKELL